MKGTWQTTDSGGGLVAIVAVVIILGIVAGPVAAAAAALVRLMLIAVAVLAAVTVTVIGFLAWHGIDFLYADLGGVTSLIMAVFLGVAAWWAGES